MDSDANRNNSISAAEVVIIIGANSAIGQAFAVQCIKQHKIDAGSNNHQQNDKYIDDDKRSIHLITISRDEYQHSAEMHPLVLQNQQQLSWQHYQCNNSQQNIEQLVEQQIIPHIAASHGTVSRILICNGVLHQGAIQPEKKIEDINEANLLALMQMNTITPMLWLQGLVKLLSKQRNPVVISILSARVGSISDNRLGGWYSYRTSKAALNMLIKTTAVEFARRLKHVKLMAFHPGTTDTALSKPFQQNVAAEKLFTPEFVAVQLYNIQSNIAVDGQASFIDWAGNDIQW
ncbi:SDR family NAD(P)-dependent oxidoreductase [Shewanella sp. OMA3-2]|uniref:SDR family NAD(P)-dependent oxidoreductase n=1 Tax=Shewanella sp. OMA3-2 TaxID=2908650 RepID=UPI001F2F6B2F|nr:SDR family NAD(P)-dependent oxidoreductase [Shewanella sp. OMA3-2]UJF21668.1 SDR family NAD(P)-dependent oxidoreductase [Shewanella sp. OMA3-2]